MGSLMPVIAFIVTFVLFAAINLWRRSLVANQTRSVPPPRTYTEEEERELIYKSPREWAREAADEYELGVIHEVFTPVRMIEVEAGKIEATFHASGREKPLTTFHANGITTGSITASRITAGSITISQENGI